jgi:hypothetical protein
MCSLFFMKAMHAIHMLTAMASFNAADHHRNQHDACMFEAFFSVDAFLLVPKRKED